MISTRFMGMPGFVARGAAKRMVLPDRIELSTSPLPMVQAKVQSGYAARVS
jgi:hypothetical protein